jgi:hypothetical protein
MVTILLISRTELLTGRDATDALADLPEPHRLTGPADWLANEDHRTIAELIAAGFDFNMGRNNERADIRHR